MMRPIPDKAEVSLDFPEKLYMGTFERSSRFAVSAGPRDFTLKLEKPGAESRRVLEIHFHLDLFAAILEELADTLAASNPVDERHRAILREATDKLSGALAPAPAS